MSIDSYFSHVAWVRNIKEKFGVEITFPIIEDLSMKVAHACGMIQPGASDTSAVRATYLIDDKVNVPPPADADGAEMRMSERATNAPTGTSV